MKNYVKSIEAIVEEMGGFWIEDHACFRFDEPVSDDGGESLSLSAAIEIQETLMDEFEFPGALLGHPIFGADATCIYFPDTRLLDVELE